MDWEEIRAIENESTKDSIIFLRKIYYKMTGNLSAAIFLSALVYWYLPDKTGRSKLRINRDGFFWIAKTYKDWLENYCISRYQLDKAAKICEDLGMVEIRKMKFDGAPTRHFRIITDEFSRIYSEVLSKSICRQSANPIDDGEQMEMSTVGKSSIAKITTHTTTKNKTKSLAKPSSPKSPIEIIKRAKEIVMQAESGIFPPVEKLVESAVLWAYSEQNGGITYNHFEGKHRKGLKSIIKKAELQTGAGKENPVIWLAVKEKLSLYRILTEEGDDFWRSQPITLSRFDGHWDSLIKGALNQTPQGKAMSADREADARIAKLQAKQRAKKRERELKEKAK